MSHIKNKDQRERIEQKTKAKSVREPVVGKAMS
jgi:hypothetical protein